MNLLKNVEFQEVLAPIAAGSSINSDSDIIDMEGFEGVTFITPITDSADTGVATMNIEQNSANSASGMAALSGAIATVTSAANDDINGQLLIVDVYRPKERYLRANLTSATANIAYGNTIAVKYGAKKKPITQGSTVAASTQVVSPAEA
ncbi:MAG: hypothetical protein PQ612_06000 [Rickettsiales bacterium]|nr:hypothetical protein [Pseudomonadota bacterium]MDA0966876.1 hypothetical protein [Pseudomonadota bacterium]MDG4543551.1 hypothetical protein [Rickettsiales bacterium]MDG4545699.1 hypothetical protein [Rickettsiales bacterium]MDG4547528.1 hypothetical protein [Rickettsiales bacterium]